MKKRTLLILMIAFCTQFSNFSIAKAQDLVDFSEKIAVLENLIDVCDKKGIPTDYEKINYETIKRFEDYINQDIANGMDNVEYNINAIEKLYNEAKNNLEGFISGEKEPFYVEHVDMDNITTQGAALYDGNKPAFSVGYGHFGQARSDVVNFQKFGVNNVQVEVGPTYLVKQMSGWGKATSGTIDATIEKCTSDMHSGNFSVEITNNTARTANTFIRLYTTVDCKPETKYGFGCYSKGTKVSNMWMSANGFSDRNYLSASSDWKLNSFSYTTSASQEVLSFQILSEEISHMYADDFFLYELDANNNIVGDNLLSNPGFEKEDDYQESIRYVLDVLKNAERNNIGVSLLVSPHYFPGNLSSDVYVKDSSFVSFLRYNVDAEETREVIENYLRILLPHLAEYPALQNICISNEPVYSTANFENFYISKFREYLKTVHGSIQNLNAAYGTSYPSFNWIYMPSGISKRDALAYDWMEFNDKVFAEWHEWMVGIIKEYLPQIPVHSKMMGYFTDNAENNLARGTDLELFGEFSDYAGNDTWDYISDVDLYYRTMFLYDYQHSVVRKPVYNSEDHIIADRDSVYSEAQRKHLRNNLWMGAVHGRSLSTIWIWERSYDSSNDAYNSILFRPDVVAETGKTNLDLKRLSYDIDVLQNASPDTAIFYSKPTRLYSTTSMSDTINAYKQLLNIGKKVGVVSDKSIDRLDDYKVLVLPNVYCCTDDTYDAVVNFIKNGGKVIYSGTAPLIYNEYKKSRDNSYVLENAYAYSAERELEDYLQGFGLSEITLIDEGTGEAPIGLDWQYVINRGRILINITNLEYDTVKRVSAYYNGEKLENMSELITGNDNVSTLTLDEYTPQLLKCDIPGYKDCEIVDIYLDGNTINWSVEGDYYEGANIYRVGQLGNLIFEGHTSGMSFACSESGSYIVKAVGRDAESMGKIITLSDELPCGISVNQVSVKERSVSCELQVTNNGDSYTTGVVAVRISSDSGEMDYVYHKLILQPKQSIIFKTSKEASGRIETVEFVVWDSTLSQKELSNKIIYRSEEPNVSD